MVEPRNTEPTPDQADLVGGWELVRADGDPCSLLLTDQVVEPRAAGSLPPEMRGARLDGDCGLDRPIGGWRRGDGDALVLVDRYGQAVVTLTPDGPGRFHDAPSGLRVRRP